MLAKRLIYSGHVQGVGFRYTTFRIAQSYDVAGYVKNLPDGNVEVLIEGPDRQVESIIDRLGDAMNDFIRSVKQQSLEPSNHYTKFSISY